MDIIASIAEKLSYSPTIIAALQTATTKMVNVAAINRTRFKVRELTSSHVTSLENALDASLTADGPAYPFPPVLVHETKDLRGTWLTLLDGNHRVQSVINLGLTQVSAIVIAANLESSELETIAGTANVTSSLPLSATTKKKIAHKFMRQDYVYQAWEQNSLETINLSYAKIALMFGISKGSVKKYFEECKNPIEETDYTSTSESDLIKSLRGEILKQVRAVLNVLSDEDDITEFSNYVKSYKHRNIQAPVAISNKEREEDSLSKELDDAIEKSERIIQS